MQILFVSSMESFPWGGSEELWSRATLRLVEQGHAVAASVKGWPDLHPRVVALKHAGVTVYPRVPVSVTPPTLRSRIAWRLFGKAISPTPRDQFLTLLDTFRPDLVCVSQGNVLDGLGYLERCRERNVPYVILSQANAESVWPNDEVSERLFQVYGGAKSSYFVSAANLQLLELQLGSKVPNAEVVQNPFNVQWDSMSQWPLQNDPWRLACVARLEPSAKGQDILLQVLATDTWRARNLQVRFFGAGPMQRSLQRLAVTLGLSEHVHFCGHVDNVESIWETHHALVLPSRFEGLPLALCEAMLCGRPCIVTAVAGNPEVVIDRTTGFLAEAATPMHLACAMEEAWRERDRWEEIGMAARRHAEQLFSPDPVGQFVQKLLNGLN
jgi:glycosyltransferase involved in cell wall biosynthesis